MPARIGLEQMGQTSAGSSCANSIPHRPPQFPPCQERAWENRDKRKRSGANRRSLPPTEARLPVEVPARRVLREAREGPREGRGGPERPERAEWRIAREVLRVLLLRGRQGWR